MLVRLPGIFHRHSTAHRSCVRLTKGPVLGCCSGHTGSWNRGRWALCPKHAGEWGLLEWHSCSTLARRLAGCVARHVPLLKPLSPKRLLPARKAPLASVIFPLFHSNCTCANTMLTGAETCSCRERKELCLLPALLFSRQRPAPLQRDFPSPASRPGCGWDAHGDKPNSIAVFTMTVPKGRTK